MIVITWRIVITNLESYEMTLSSPIETKHWDERVRALVEEGAGALVPSSSRATHGNCLVMEAWTITCPHKRESVPAEGWKKDRGGKVSCKMCWGVVCCCPSPDLFHLSVNEFWLQKITCNLEQFHSILSCNSSYYSENEFVKQLLCDTIFGKAFVLSDGSFMTLPSHFRWSCHRTTFPTIRSKQSKKNVNSFFTLRVITSRKIAFSPPNQLDFYFRRRNLVVLFEVCCVSTLWKSFWRSFCQLYTLKLTKPNTFSRRFEPTDWHW